MSQEFTIMVSSNDHQDLPARISVSEHWRVVYPLRLHPSWTGLTGGPWHDEENSFEASSKAEVLEKLDALDWLSLDDVLRIEFWYDASGRTTTQLAGGGLAWLTSTDFRRSL